MLDEILFKEAVCSQSCTCAIYQIVDLSRKIVFSKVCPPRFSILPWLRNLGQDTTVVALQRDATALASVRYSHIVYPNIDCQAVGVIFRRFGEIGKRPEFNKQLFSSQSA